MFADNAIGRFLNAHHAVPADDGGPTWAAASDEALVGWLRAYRATAVYGVVRTGPRAGDYRPASAAERAAALPVWNELKAELLARGDRKGLGPCSGAMASQFMFAFGRCPDRGF